MGSVAIWPELELVPELAPPALLDARELLSPDCDPPAEEDRLPEPDEVRLELPDDLELPAPEEEVMTWLADDARLLPDPVWLPDVTAADVPPDDTATMEELVSPSEELTAAEVEAASTPEEAPLVTPTEEPLPDACASPDEELLPSPGSPGAQAMSPTPAQTPSILFRTRISPPQTHPTSTHHALRIHP